MNLEEYRTPCHNAPLEKESRGNTPALVCQACRRVIVEGDQLKNQPKS